jgi:hypothetical protein
MSYDVGTTGRSLVSTEEQIPAFPRTLGLQVPSPTRGEGKEAQRVTTYLNLTPIIPDSPLPSISGRIQVKFAIAARLVLEMRDEGEKPENYFCVLDQRGILFSTKAATPSAKSGSVVMR